MKARTMVVNPSGDGGDMATIRVASKACLSLNFAGRYVMNA